MTREEFRAVLSPLVLAMRAEFDAPTWTAYYQALEDVPVGVLQLSVQTLMREPLAFFPKAGEFRAMAEKQRRVLLAAYPYDGCVECEGQRGFRTVLGTEGQKTVEACPCKARHRQHLERLGLAAPLVALPNEAGVGDVAEYPSLEQLPATVRQQLVDVAAQKVLR